MKKYSWIFALIMALALAFVFTACSGDDPEDETTDEDGQQQVTPPPYTGPKGLKVTAVASWAGVDLNNGGFNFEEGFVIEYAGTYLGAEDGKQLLLNLNHSGWKPLDGWNPAFNIGETFANVFTLTDEDVAYIPTASPPAIRIRGNAANASFIISILKVKDADGEVVFDLQDALSGLDVGETDFDLICDGEKFVPAGAPSNVLGEVVKIEQKGLKVTAVASWAGVDLDNGGLNFEEGFKVEYAGVYLGPENGKQLLLNLNHSGWKPLSDWNPALNTGDMFSKVFTLTDEDVAYIPTASPPAIRVRGNAANLSFLILTLKVKDTTDAIVFDLNEAISDLDLGESDFDLICDGEKFVPAGAPSNVLGEVVKIVQ